MTKQELLTTVEALPLESKKGLLTHFRINRQGDPQTVDLAKQIAAKIGILECLANENYLVNAIDIYLVCRVICFT